VKLSIGAGARRIEGWTHLDNDPALRPDLLADITRPLPLPDASVECIFCEEVLTQIRPEHCVDFLRECRRVLVPDGVVRVLMPDLQRFVRAYLDQPEWLVGIWNKHVAIPLFTGSAAEVLNVGLRAVGPFVYDRASFATVAEMAGMELLDSAFNHSLHAAMRGLDMRGPEETLTVYYELRAPG
jgi:hypothetical protein